MVIVMQKILCYTYAMKKVLKILFSVSGVVFCGVLLTQIVQAISFQDTKELDFSFTFSPTLAISLSSDELVIDDLMPGNYDYSNTISVNVSTNNAFGYTLYAKVGGTSGAAAANNRLVNSAGGFFASLAMTDELTLANFGAGKWGFTTENTISGSTVYSGLSYGFDRAINKTRHYDGSCALNNSGGCVYPGGSLTKFTIGASASDAQASGVYTNVITFVAVDNIATPNSITDLTHMQDFATLTSSEWNSIVNSMRFGEQYKLIDNRDNNEYYIAKQADGKVWMTQNLDLCIGCSGVAALTSRNTDLNIAGGGIYNTTTGGYSVGSDGVITWNPVNGPTNDRVVNASSIVDYGDKGQGYAVEPLWPASTDEEANAFNVPYSAEGGDNYVYTSGNRRADTWYSSLESCKSSHSESECKHYHVGNYYNWPAAIASNDASGMTSRLDIAENSICPAGWKLPEGFPGYDYGHLFSDSGVISGMSTDSYATDGFKKIRSNPLYLVRAGLINNTGLVFSVLYTGGNAHGYYWTSSAGNEYYSDRVIFDRNSVGYGGGGSNRFGGYTVRCVLRSSKTINDLTYMQDFATLSSSQKTSILSSMTQDQQYTLTDSRDGKEYFVAKLADGNVWMTQNLDHDIGDIAGGTYTPADTDIKANWTPSSDAITKVTSDTSWDETSTGYNIPQSYDPGNVCWDGTIHNTGDALANSTVSCSDDSVNVHYSIGNYYSWTAAVAMNDSNGYINTDVNQSICPAGWMLPKSGTAQTGSGSFQYLVNQLSLTAGTSGNIQDAPVFFVYGGQWTGSSWAMGSGLYRSSVASKSNGATYYLGFSSRSTVVRPSDSGYDQSYGRSVRCVAR